MTTTASETQKVFNPISWKKNRSKYKVLKLLSIAEPKTLTSFEWIYANAGVPYNTVAAGLIKWQKWRYISVGQEDGVKVYHLLNPGRLFIKKLSEKVCPGAVKIWDAELREWWSFHPPIMDWTMPDLKRLIEPMLAHRLATHPGPSIYRKGGCYWVWAGKIYLLHAPYTDYVVKPLTKRKKLGSNWSYCRSIEEVVSYVSFKAPQLHYSVAEELVRKSVRGF